MELLANFGLIISGHMQLVLDLVFSVSEGTSVPEFATTKGGPVLAKLSLELHPVAFDEALSLLVISELPLRLSGNSHDVFGFPSRRWTRTLCVLIITARRTERFFGA